MLRGRKLAKQAAAERYRVPHSFEGVGVKFLRNQPDGAPGIAVVLNDIMAGCGNVAAGFIHDTADNRDERGLAGSVGAKQSKNFTGVDFQVDVFQNLEAPLRSEEHTSELQS